MKTQTQIEAAIIDATRVIQTLQHLNPEALNKSESGDQKTVRDRLNDIIETLKSLS